MPTRKFAYLDADATVQLAPVDVSIDVIGVLPVELGGTGRADGTVFFTPQTAPASPTDGLVYYDSGTNKLRVRAAGAWVDLH